MRLNIRSYSIAFGIVFGGYVFMLTWWLIVRGYYVGEQTFIGAVYPFYTVSPAGSIIGGLMAFADGMICGALFAWLYNKLNKEK
ncbi:MAG: hypothetical protein JW982_01580 [Spirochaetes bacterium]|nr:hypothetical protein [Spirochaetota bacterium]